MPMLKTVPKRCAGWMTLFTSTVAVGGWMERHPPYDTAPLARESIPVGIGAAR
jgi:hypothetical protein